MTESVSRMKAFYLRTNQNDDTKLDDQYELLKEEYGVPDEVYKDKASGTDENREGLQELIKQVQHGNISTVYITHKDRLTRFGYSYLESMFNYHGAEIVVLPTEEKALDKELLDDFMSILDDFSWNYYRMNGYTRQKKFISLAKGKLIEDNILDSLE